MKAWYYKNAKKSRELRKPFASEIWKRAGDISSQYQIILVKEDGLWFGRGVELYYSMSHGKTPAQCVKHTHEAMQVVVAIMLEDDELPPRPCNQLRDEQLNIRLSTLEKKQLEVDAVQGGFSSVSDFVRFKAINKMA